MAWCRLFHSGYRNAGRLGLAVLWAGPPVVPGILAAQHAAQPAAQSAPPAGLAFRGVTVIDVTDGRRRPDQTVLVVGNRVQAVGSASDVQVPSDAQVIDAKGKYLIPGLWDMHTHNEWDFLAPEVDSSTLSDSRIRDSMYRATYRWVYPLYIANGITGIREMGQRWRHGTAFFREWQREIMAGTQVGPRAIGPSVDVSNPEGGEFVAGEDSRTLIPTVRDAPRVLDSLKAAGDVFVKFHDDWLSDRDVFFAILREARRVGLPVVGHIPEVVTNVEAADSGMRSIEHRNQQRQCEHYAESDSTAPEESCAAMVQAYIRNGTWLTPTLIYHLHFGRTPEWDNTVRFWRMLHRMGVKKFLAGTDWATWVMRRPSYQVLWPGLSAREELVFLTEAGLTPLEALQAGTLNPAVFLNATDSLGTVAPGKLADLVLLDADPLADIANVLKLWGVVANGRYFDRATLERMDPEGFKPGKGIVARDRGLRRAPAPDSGQADRPAP